MESVLKTLWTLPRDATGRFLRDEGPHRSAALAFYSLFSLAPLVVVVITVAGLVLRPGPVRQELLRDVETWIGPAARRSLDPAIENISRSVRRGGGAVAIIVSSALVLVGASAVFRNLLGALNQVWEVPTRKHRRLWGFLRRRLMAFVLALAAGAILLASVIVQTALRVVESWIRSQSGVDLGQWVALDIFGSFILAWLMVALVFQVVPDADLHWRHVIIGSLVTAALLTLAQWVISLYVSRINLRSIYPAAGSAFLMLLWFYLAWMVFFWGAEFTYVLNRIRGERIPGRREKGRQ